MSITLKEQLINKISVTNDEDLLLLLNNDFDYFTKESGYDVTDELSPDDKSELINMVHEPFGKNTISQQELDEALRQWRTK